MRRAIFIDKDGTLVVDVPYNVDPRLVLIEDNVITALRKLSRKDYLLIVITNQSGLAHGYFDEKQLGDLENHLTQLLQKEGITINGFYYCPHYPGASIQKFAISCDCRKPLPGLFFKAASDFKIDLKNSWMIGDILNDVEAGNRAGCRSILINNGNETEWVMDNESRSPLFIAKDMGDAADFIMKQDSQNEDKSENFDDITLKVPANEASS